jgi:hypothetical protein
MERDWESPFPKGRERVKKVVTSVNLREQARERNGADERSMIRWVPWLRPSEGVKYMCDTRE